MTRCMTYQELTKQITSSEKEIFQLKQNSQAQDDTHAVSNKHCLTHMAVLECVELILQHHSFVVTAKNIFASCKQIVEAKAGFVALTDHTGKYLEVLHLDTGGLSGAVNCDSPMPIRGFRQEAMNKGMTLCCNTFKKSKWMKLLPKGHVPLNNVLLAPLVIEHASVGLLGFANKQNDFDSDDILIASSFAKLTALALANSKAWLVMNGKIGSHVSKTKKLCRHL